MLGSEGRTTRSPKRYRSSIVGMLRGQFSHTPYVYLITMMAKSPGPSPRTVFDAMIETDKPFSG